MFRIDPINFDDTPEDEGNGEFHCPCGDEHCRGYDDDPGLIRIGRTFYASDCVMANHHPLVVEGRAREARRDERAGK